MEHASGRRFPANPKDYKLYEEVGEGVSATVYRALCIPFNEIVAIKVLDLEKCNNDFEGIRREVQMMTLIDHPNVLRAYCSFTADRSLWVVMPFMAGGSCLHIIKSAYTEGFEEPVIAILLKEVLKALVYLHGHGHIHRDVKAGNILVDTNGAVKLADFGVSACMFDTGDRQRARNTFAGTPCWMAPEVMQQLHGYDFKADIWSFGITALELAHGHAPFSKYPPMKVLLMTLQNAPPGLDYERDKRFSKSFKDLVATCLVKDPKKRPSSEKLLKHSFFKRVRSNEYLAKSILDGLSPLGDRFKKLKDKEADFLLQNKAMYEDKEHLSQREYIKGISGWNFNLEDLKKQAALLDDDDGIPSTKDLGTVPNSQNGLSNGGSSPDFLSSQTSNDANCAAIGEEEVDQQNFEGSFASSFPSRPLQALKGYFDVCEDETSTSSPDGSNIMHLSPEHLPMPIQKQPSQIDDTEVRSPEITSLPKDKIVPTEQKNLSGLHMQDRAISPYRNIPDDINRSTRQPKHRPDRNHSGPLTYRQKRDPQCEQFASTHEESSEGRVIRQKGRFKITSEDPGSKGLISANSSTNPVTGAPTNATGTGSVSLSLLQFILQQNAMQREQLSKLLRYMELLSSGCRSESADVGTSDLSQFSPASSREQELLSYALQLQQSITNLGEEVQKLKVHNAQLQQQLSAHSNKGKVPVQLDKQPQS